MLGIRLLLIILFVSAVGLGTQASAHTHRTVDKKTYIYDGILGGADGTVDCCTGNHCRPAVGNPKQTPTGWSFVVLTEPKSPDSPLVTIEVPEAQVTYRDLFRDGAAHWCGTVSTNPAKVAHTTRCAFIPPKPTTRSEEILDAALRRPALLRGGFFTLPS